MIQLPQLQESLLIANERLVDRARRRARLFRMGLLSSAAALSIGGAAVAGQALWGPVLGREDGNRPTASATPVPAEQREVLGVLRREQTSHDRGAAAREALAAAARQYRGVRLADVRRLHDGPNGTIVLIPVADLKAVPGFAIRAEDALCIVTRVAPGDAASTCSSLDDVRSGRVTGFVGRLMWGVVPDGVASVVVSSNSSGSQTVGVTDNAFTASGSDLDPDRPTVEWLDAAGRAVTPAGGQPMRLPVLAATESIVPPGFKDCGATAGGVVPDAVDCGADARDYRPGIGRDARPSP